MPAGRPTVMTDEVLQKLETAFLMGCTDSEACLAADIAPSTLYAYCKENQAFSERKETLKNNPVFLAKGIQLEALQDGDKSVALDLLKRKEGSKLNVGGQDDNPIRVDTPWKLTGVKVVERAGG